MLDNIETVAHYYEGCVIEVDIDLDPALESEYAANEEGLLLPLDQYGWGKAKMRCPEGATWYSFSNWYLKSHVRSVQEIFPCLLPYILPLWEDLEKLHQ